jgi:hypothetical protein
MVFDGMCNGDAGKMRAERQAASPCEKIDSLESKRCHKGKSWDDMRLRVGSKPRGAHPFFAFCVSSRQD